MDDILSDLCDLPTGVHSLEFLPKHEISVWESGVPVPINRWYGIGAYRNKVSYQQPTDGTVHGDLTPIGISCLVINDSQEIADLLQQMGQMRFVLRISHHSGKRRIIGFPEEYMKLATTEYIPEEIIGAQGYKLNFTGALSKRPIVLS